MKVYLGLGGNENMSFSAINNAIHSIQGSSHSSVTKISNLYRSKPWGIESQSHFLNLVIEIETELSPANLLDYALSIEAVAGRNRADTIKWGPRILDIDILVFGNQIIKSPELSIPHPYISEREFVYIPLLECNKEIEIPGIGKLKEAVSSSHHMELITPGIEI